MAPVIEKHMMQLHQQEQNQSSSVLGLKETGTGNPVTALTNVGPAQSFVQNALNHGHGRSHGHHHHHNHHHQQNLLNLHHYNVHAKENAASNRMGVSGSGSKRGLEILDFHESWREEVEMYKDVKKQINQQLAGSQGTVHMPQAAPMELIINVNANRFPHVTKQLNINNNNPTDHNSVSNTTATSSFQTNVKRNISHENKSRGAESSDTSNQRPREELPSKTASGVKFSSPRSAKRTGRNSPPTVDNKTSASVTRNNSPTKNNFSTASNNNSPARSFINSTAITSSPAKNNTKIIVNQFHASSLLNGHHYEEKEEILKQNGLTNPQSATAYEASFYAANYLTPDARNNSYYNSNNGGNGSNQSDDDPCSAIDDDNTGTETDSEDEYTGDPFYLAEDRDETQQSKHIRYQPPVEDEHSELSDESNATNATCIYSTPKSILSPSLFPNVPPYLNFSSHAKTGPPMPPSLHRVLKWKLSPVMPRIVKRVVLNSGFRIIKNTTDWMAVWEKHMKSPGFRTIRSHQKYNHMPGSFRIGRKDTMWRSIQQNIKKFGNKEFGIMQRSFIMPDDLEDLRLVWPKRASKQARWIIKPPASARGTGISIVNKWSQFPKDRPLVVQQYIERPLLINDNKFDMRLYVVMTSINPLRIYMYKDGLARFASIKYSSELGNLDERCMHLTNYSINKFSHNYTKNQDFNACHGHKWTLQSLWSCLESRGVNTKRLWATLRNLVIKAIISGEAGINRTYRQNVNFRYNCFELFGFDVLLDENLIPWLLEINISPSLHSELPLDLHVKGPLIQAILNTALYQVPPKLNEKTQKDILEALKLDGPLCHDRRIFTTCLRNDEIRKHNHFTNRSIEYREEYLDAILDNLNPDDVRCLILTEDELNRSSPLERVFPTPDTHTYLKYIEHPRYYNRLLDAWEARYGHCREKGIELLRTYCSDNYHLHVPEAALEKEPVVDVTEIDMLHVRKSAEQVTDATSVPLSTDVGDSTDNVNPPQINKNPSTCAINVTLVHLNNESQDESKNIKNKKNHTANQKLNKIQTKTDVREDSTGKLKTEIKVS